MADHPRSNLGLGALAGALAGAGVGLLDGVRAALLVGGGARVVVATALLAASVDALVGVLGGAVAEALVRLAVWGRRARPPTWGRLLARAAAGAGAAAAAAAVVSATALRRNRFLAAGLTALAGVLAALAGALLAPAAARLLGGRRSVAAAGAVVFAALSRTRAPLRGDALIERSVWSAGAAFLLPFGLAWAEARPLPVGGRAIRWRAVGLLAGGVYGGAALVALAVFWGDDLRFAPWTDILGAAAIAAAGVGGALLLRPRLPRARGAAAGVAAAVGLVATVALFRAAESEPARKVGSARAALVGPALETGRALLDFDGDGYARALGGGDCDDADPDIHPGAVDIPGDGIDADCDGQDATDALPPPATMAELPTSVPRDLNLLLVTIDTLRADHLGCYGYGRPTSPAIDALAASGALFENWWPRIGRNMRTTALALHDDGYFTAGMFSFNYFAIGDHRGFERGMDLYRS